MSDGTGLATGVVGAVTLGTAVLLYGTYSHTQAAQLVGGLVAVAAIGLLAAYIHSLPSPAGDEH